MADNGGYSGTSNGSTVAAIGTIKLTPIAIVESTTEPDYWIRAHVDSRDPRRSHGLSTNVLV